MNIRELYTQVVNYKKTQKNTSAQYRVGKLKVLRDLILNYKEDIASALQKDLGKAPTETYITEVLPVLSMLNQSIKSLPGWMKDKKVATPLALKGASSYIRYEGKGACLVLSPWNYPFQLAMYPVVNSFMCGNTTIIKPSEYTENTNKIIELILSKAFSSEEVSLIHGGVETSQALLELEFDHIFFTGSTAVGKVVMKAASEHLASVSLELGGKSPVYLDKTADLSESIKKIAWAKLVNAGQTCVAPDYMLTNLDEEKIKELFIKYLDSAYKNEFENNADYCRIITERHAQRLKELVDDAVEKGAKILVGGSLVGNRCLEPTLLVNVDNSMKVMQEEIFGPILPILKVDNVDQATEFINTTDNPLAAYVFSSDRQIQDKFMNETYSGGVTVNDILINVANVNLPFGGAGKSGIGKYHGHEGFIEFSNARAVMDRKMDLGASYLFPPYTKLKESRVVALFRSFSRFL